MSQQKTAQSTAAGRGPRSVTSAAGSSLGASGKRWDPKKWSEEVIAECEKRGILRRGADGEYLEEDLRNMYSAFILAMREMP